MLRLDLEVNRFDQNLNVLLENQFEINAVLNSLFIKIFRIGGKKLRREIEVSQKYFVFLLGLNLKVNRFDQNLNSMSKNQFELNAVLNSLFINIFGRGQLIA